MADIKLSAAPAAEDALVTGRVFQVQRFSVHDGDGLRTTVFFKGCPLRCRWCHNPEGLVQDKQLAYLEAKCLSCGLCAAACPNGVHSFENGRHIADKTRCAHCGACEAVCPAGALNTVGRDMTALQVVKEVEKDRPFYGTEGGLTCSGGECTMQPRFLLAVLRLAKAAGLNTAVDTCGASPWQTYEAILPYTDLFLYDLKAHSPRIHREYTGVDNGAILSNYRRLMAAGAKVDVRIPLIPGVNDSWDELLAIGRFMAEAGVPRKLKVIPYHTPGENKYAQLDLDMWQPDEGRAGIGSDEAQAMLDELLYG